MEGSSTKAQRGFVDVRRSSFLAALLLIPALASAQSIRGVVVGPADSVGVPGAVVLLLDPSGGVAARALTNERGEFRLAAPAAGPYLLRTMRIGSRPVVSNPVQLVAGRELLHPPIVTGATVTLDTVRVVGRNACRIHGDSAVATYALWEQARTALTATDLTARARTMAATIVTYERSTEPGSGKVREQSAGIRSGFTARPWITRPVDSLRRAGYVETGAHGWVTYYAPDLEMLLSNAFLEDHCFRIARSSDVNRVGVEFEPIDARKELPEIRGVVWLDRRSSELQKMEFRYTSVLREQERHGAGGEMDFVRMKNGAWAIARWHIRMPVLVERAAAEPSGIPGMPAKAERRVTEVRIAGGEIALVALGGDTLWSRPPLSFRGTVVDSTSGAPVRGAKVALKGTQLSAATDATGRFSIPGVLPGEYWMQVTTPSMDSVGLLQEAEIVFADESVPIMFRLRKRALFHGFVFADSSGRPIPGAIVSLQEVSMSARADETGRFRLYEVPAGLHTVAVRQPGFTDLTVKLQFNRDDIIGQRFVLRLAPVPTATLATADPRGRFLRDLEERRTGGHGHFITREQLQKKANYRTADLLSSVPGLRIVRSPSGPQAWASSGRGKVSIELERQPDNTSRSRGAPNACYSDVYLDGVAVYAGSGSDLFDLNTLVPEMLEAIEFYVSGSHVPPEYNRTGSLCGVLLFWTRRG
jgi:carboxypeptidase family protein/TonB-dependent receptor-like protein